MLKYNTKWTRKETLAAFNLYCAMPFRKVNSRNSTIIALAKKLERTPASLSMKMGNLAWHDPKNPSSLGRGSKLDEEIWEQYFSNPEALTYESEQAIAFYEGTTLEARSEISDDIAQLPEGKERRRLVRTRVNQSFFRRAVLSAYQNKCCITELAVPTLLNASHIIPWREKRERTNPSNGLCLNVLHDRAFDRGLITVRPNGIVVVSTELRKHAEKCGESAFVIGCADEKIRMPDKFAPTQEFLEYHNREIFIGELSQAKGIEKKTRRILTDKS